MRTAMTCLIVLTVLGGCQSGGEQIAQPTGYCQPTCAGRACAEFADYETAREAFTRQSKDKVLLASLEDASWLRFEGTPDEVAEKHKAYFDYGYTTFAVVLRAKEFSQPTKEVFLLEDSTGKRVTGKPLTYRGALQRVDDRWTYTFSISFQHTITSEIQWLKLTRMADGEFVEWQFGVNPTLARGG